MDRDDEAELAPRELLEEWIVPPMPIGLKERVMTQMQEHYTFGSPAQAYAPPVRRASITPTVMATAAIAAAAAALVLAVRRPEPPAAIVHEPPTFVAVAAERAAPARGHLTFEVDPIDATVEIDGRAIAGPSPFIATGLEPGPHAIRIHHDGRVEWTRTIDVPATQLSVRVDLQPIAPPLEAVASATAEGASAPAEPRASGDPVGDGKPKSKVRQAKADVKGGLDKDIVRRIVRAHIDEIRVCYNEGLAKDAELHGRVVIQFTIASSGSVVVAVVQESTIADGAVGQCMAKAVKRWKFPRPEGGGNVVVAYPFVLEGG